MTDSQFADAGRVGGPNALTVTSRVRESFFAAFRSPVSLIACVGGLFFLLGQFASAIQNGEKLIRADKVVAERFEVVSRAGKTAALLQTDADGKAVLSFLDTKGSVALDVGMSTRGEPKITLYDSAHQEKLGLIVSAGTGTPACTLKSGPNGSSDLTLQVTEQGPVITLVDSGKGAIIANVRSDHASVSVLGGLGTEPALLLTATAGNAKISLKAKDRIRSSWTTLTGGSPGFFMLDDRDQARLSFTLPGGAPLIALSGRDGVDRAALQLRTNDSPAIDFCDQKGKLRLSVGLDPDSKPMVLPIEP
jgi:hypothetical protein